MKAYSLTIDLIEPVLVTALGGDPNANLTLPYLPGSALRGALIARYLQAQPNVDLPSWFLSGQVRFLNAYPMAGGQRAVPAPQALVRDKQHPEVLINRLAAPAPIMPKSAGAEFVQIKEQQLSAVEILDEYIVHNARDRRIGHAGSAEDGLEGAVFLNQTLARGTRFQGAILIDDDDAINAAELKGLLASGRLHLGGSASASYGTVQLTVAALPADWQEVNVKLQALPAGEKLTLILLSDAITRSQEGQYGDFVVQALQQRWGAGAVRLEAAYTQLTLVGGFNRKWGLPLPQEWAVRAGSSYHLVTERTISVAELTALQQVGLGERRAEGFGRLALNWPLPAELRFGEALVQDQSPATRSQSAELPLSEAESGLADHMLERWLRQRLDQAVAAKVNRLVQGAGRSGTSTSQLARLRIQCRQAARQGSLAPLVTYIEQVALHANARDQLQRARVGGRNLHDWLKDWAMADPAGEIWQSLDAHTIQAPAIYSGSRWAAWQSNQALQVEYILRLLDGVLARMMKQKREVSGD